jgi:hypothetical protein
MLRNILEVLFTRVTNQLNCTLVLKARSQNPELVLELTDK